MTRPFAPAARPICIACTRSAPTSPEIIESRGRRSFTPAGGCPRSRLVSRSRDRRSSDDSSGSFVKPLGLPPPPGPATRWRAWGRRPFVQVAADLRRSLLPRRYEHRAWTGGSQECLREPRLWATDTGLASEPRRAASRRGHGMARVRSGGRRSSGELFALEGKRESVDPGPGLAGTRGLDHRAPVELDGDERRASCSNNVEPPVGVPGLPAALARAE